MTATSQAAARITIPLFPLPDVVLFPGQVLPLHIFEPRYRCMVEDALAGDRRLGMALLKPGWEEDYGGSPAIYPTVGFGVIEESTRFEDGRFLIRLKGEGRGRVEAEVQQVPYRKALCAILPEQAPSPELGAHVSEIVKLFATIGKVNEPQRDALEIVNMVASTLPLRPEVKLELLELDDPSARARRVVELLERQVAQQLAIQHFRPRGEWDGSRN